MHSIQFLALALLTLIVAMRPGQAEEPSAKPEVDRLKIVIDPNTPLARLLPRPPRIQEKTVNPFEIDLAKVPEVNFQEPLSPRLTKEWATYKIAHQHAKIRHLNQKKTDAFMEALISRRPDLQGLPFILGTACRTVGDRAKLLGLVGLGVHQIKKAAGINADYFWNSLNQWRKGWRDFLKQDMNAAYVTALMQVLAPESAAMRQVLIKILAKVPQIEATKALARLALFSAEDEVRRPALEALKSRPQKDYQEILMQGFRYPLPDVAKRAAEAVARLKLKDLMPPLVELIDEPDPRLPVLKTINGKKLPVIRELVRINHHRNCMLCHAPASFTENNLETTAPVPLPTEPLPSPPKGYNREGPKEILVRIDTTYLRQDFSVMLPVADAAPWPEMQRFDFLVRTRVLSEQEAAEYRKQAPRVNPYQRAVLFALRELAGR